MPKIKSKLGKRALPAVFIQAPSDNQLDFPVDHYSYSSMVKFTENPILFKICYVNRDRYETTSNVSGVIGRAFHLAMEVYYRGNPEMMPADEQQAIEFGLKAGLDFLDKYNDGFIEYSERIPNKQKAQEVFAFAYNSYIKDKPYTGDEVIQGIEQEICEKVSVTWRGQKLNLPVKLKGYPDKIIKTKDGKLIIKDYKTCASFSDPDKIDGAKIIQAVQYYLLVYAKYGIEPYSMVYEEVKLTANRDGGKQVKIYEIVYSQNELYFDFYFRLYEDITAALNGHMVYVPNVRTMFDNEVSLISYIHRLDIAEEKAKEMKRLKVDNITDVLKKKIQNAGNMRKLLKTIEDKFTMAKNINYEAMNNEEKIRTKLMEFGMILDFDSKVEGASVDLYRFNPTIGLKMSRLGNYVADIEQVIGKSGIRVLAPIPGSNLVGFEVPREVRNFPALPENQGFELAIGQTIQGEVRRFDVRTAPHLLVAGSSGSGKSVFLHALIRQLKNLPSVSLHLFDPKQVELSKYDGEVEEYQDEHKNIAESLGKLVDEMEKRYKKMKKSKAKNISDTNMNYKFVIIDEYADLVLSQSVQTNIQLLAQKGRAAGVHIILATQRASTKVISGDIKVNFPVKVVFRMAKDVDSRVMLDESGAEKLLGKGDCLFASDSGVERLQAFNI
jgi:S-DNA-T family DNA segregation ATPase FtsK/SpoIIIE